MEKKNNSLYNGFKTQKGNYIWAAALTLAWKQLCSSILKQPVKIDSSDQEVLKIVQNFNKAKFDQSDIDKNSIYTKSGFGQQTVDKINAQSKKKFPSKSFGDLNIKLSQTDLIVYAYLLKNIQFKTPFKRSDENTFQFEGQSVASFYALNSQQKQQIYYSYYKSPDQFMISIQGKKDGDLIYFIKNKEIPDVDHAIKAVEFYQDKQKNHLSSIDHFQMPVVQLDLKREFKNLAGNKLKNKNLSGYSLQYVFQALKLKIDQKGATVQNQAVISILTSAFSPNQPQPKYFILDKQFWVVMKQYKKHPYLCCLIKNPIQTNGK